MNDMQSFLSQLHRSAVESIGNGVHVWRRYAVDIADNGLAGDTSITLYIAPEFGGDDDTQWIYLATNGDPVIVGRLNGASVTVSDDAVEFLEADDYGWVCEALVDLDPDVFD